MPEMFLTPGSISFLSLALLAAIIMVYFARFQRKNRQGQILLVLFTSLTLLSLLFFLDNASMPSGRPFAAWFESPVLAVLMAAMIHFAYYFPGPVKSQKIERWVVFLLFAAYTGWELEFAIQRVIHVIETGGVFFRSEAMNWALVAEIVCIVFIFARSSFRNWKLPAVRNFALILLIPLGLAVMQVERGINGAITYLYPIVLPIGLLFTIFLFAVNYLTSQPEQTSFVVKISGAALTSVLAVFASIAWLVTPAYAAQFHSPAMDLDHRTIQFQPDGRGGYQVREVPFQWETSLGEKVPVGFDRVRQLSFPFPFFGQPYASICVSPDGAIGVGSCSHFGSYQYHFLRIPMIYPLLVKLNADLTGGDSVYIRQDPGLVVITWNQIRSHFHGDFFTFQVSLRSDGTIAFTYNGLPAMRYAPDDVPEAVAWVTGIKPVNDPPGTGDFTQLPMQIGPEGILQDYHRAFRIYLDDFLKPLAVAILASSLVFLVGMAALLHFQLARPLNSLLSGVQNFNQGQREQSIPIRSNDEIGYLTDSFNKLVAELNSFISGLEQRVAERTTELSAANRQLKAEIEARALAQEQVIERQRAVAILEERERMARELHDGIGQVLGFLNVQAQSASDSLRAGERQSVAQLLGRISEVAQDAHDDVRGYILGLKKDIHARPWLNLMSRIEQYTLHLSQEHGFQTVIHRPEELPGVIAAGAIEEQLFFVIREALSNACAHSGEKQAEVTLVVAENWVTATVEDHGRGMVQAARSGHVGLSIMRERAEGVGGRLEIHSTPEAGTRVFVSLPRRLEGSPLPSLRLLLVDDHPLFLEGLVNLVTGRGMQVVGTANDGLEAQEKARALKPDVILMDIEMPGCDGIEATRRIKAELPEVKVVILTVSGEERHLFEALRCGASGYLLKSLEAAELTCLLEELLRGEVSLSPDLARKMLEAFTRHKSPLAQPPGVSPETERKETQPPEPMELTPRQMEILRLVAQGCMYKEIALQLGLAEVTIKYHMGEILARLHLNSRHEAVQYFQSGKLD